MGELRRSMTRRVKAFLKDIRGPWAYRNACYAQEGEDAVLARLFGKRRDGFYVDVGCHHPHRFSNTYAFYRRGWRGICIDPLPGVAARFRRWRPRDIALEVGISERPAELTYYMFNEPALNTFSAELAREREGGGSHHWRLIERRQVPTLPLWTVLERHLPAGQDRIDFMSVDVEGMDLEVLRSCDWSRHRPRYVIAECLNADFDAWSGDPVVRWMRAQGYRPLSKLVHSVIFEGEEQRNGVTA